MANRLSDATSPYLLQHASNPVDWWPWCDEAFAEARRRDVPVLLSVGYAACHWCHVMAHESFEDEAVAAQLAAGFVSIKVDREERPDVDAVYMEATQAMTGQGGWPMTCLLTPDGAPFFCGTYFPNRSFRQLLEAATEAWTTRRDDVVTSGQRIVASLSVDRRGDAVTAPPAAGELDAAAAALVEQADAVNGGFGGAPKFPPSMVLEFLLRHAERTGSTAGLDVAVRTGEAMARGGMYDQLAGGFSRYSVDAGWVVPHFEKMLYDNALLLRFYLHLERRTGSSLAGRIADETAEFLLRDLGTAHGGFASALDADTDGVEGLTYVWTPAQLREVLGDDDGAWAATVLAVTDRGSFEHGRSTLQLRHEPDDPARWQRVRAALLNARSQRPQPARDDKVVTAWNGLAVAALAELGAVRGEPRWVDAASRCADLLLGVHLVGGRLRRTSRGGTVGEAAGIAEDYGDLADGLLTLHQATAEPHWLRAAQELLDTALHHFSDAGSDGVPTRFFDTADDAEALIRRPWDPTDNATPSGQSALAMALLTSSALTGSSWHRAAAEAALGVVGGAATSHPRFLGWALAVAEAAVAGPRQVAVAGEDTTGPLASLAWRRRGPGDVVVAGAPDATGVPLLADRALVDGRPAAYVCRGMVCDLPVTDVDALAAQLTQG